MRRFPSRSSDGRLQGWPATFSIITECTNSPDAGCSPEQWELHLESKGNTARPLVRRSLRCLHTPLANDWNDLACSRIGSDGIGQKHGIARGRWRLLCLHTRSQKIGDGGHHEASSVSAWSPGPAQPRSRDSPIRARSAEIFFSRPGNSPEGLFCKAAIRGSAIHGQPRNILDRWRTSLPVTTW